MSFKDRLNKNMESWQRQRPSAGGSTPSGVSSQAARWQERADQYQQGQEKNPFSGGWRGSNQVELDQKDDQYGRPPEGSKTEYRGKQAGVRIGNEIIELCNIIQELGTKQPNGTSAVTFGLLFETYTRISNKLVGMLLRARKQGLVMFEGEMLYQRRDDDVVIWLVQSPQALMEDIEVKKRQLQEHGAHGDMKK